MVEKGDNLSNLAKLYPIYLEFNNFIENNKVIQYHELEHFITYHLSLFTIATDFDFDLLERQIKRINDTLPAINNIFKRPLLHLKDEDIVMPVEAVHKMDNETFNHIFSHTEFWEDLQDRKIKPNKLLTKVYQDNYGIYENLVFCDTIDNILFFVNKMRKILQGFILTKQKIEINLLERNNHLSYLLALGKLYPGYMRWYNEFCEPIQQNYQKLNLLSEAITSKLHRPVYRKNINRSRDRKIKKTNILAMHKDYHRIYSLIKFFNRKQVDTTDKLNEIKLEEMRNAYFNFCQIQLLFALNHFNFECHSIIDFSRLDLDFSFKKWKINVSNNHKFIYLKIEAEKKYQITLYPTIEQNDEILSEVDELIICTSEFKENQCQISLGDIESFRRLQQIILRGMLKADDTRDECPFCANQLVKQEDKTIYVCNHCRTIVGDTICTNTSLPFVYTSIFGSKHNRLPFKSYNDDKEQYYRRLEEQLFYRNITKLNDYSEIICPHCGAIHGD